MCVSPAYNFYLNFQSSKENSEVYLGVHVKCLIVLSSFKYILNYLGRF